MNKKIFLILIVTTILILILPNKASGAMCACQWKILWGGCDHNVCGWTSSGAGTPTKSCMIGTPLEVGMRDLCKEDCSSADTICRSDACPVYDGWNGENCSLRASCGFACEHWGGTGPNGTCGAGENNCHPMDLRWDAKEYKCVECVGNKESKIWGDTGGIYCGCNNDSIIGDGQCESACGASEACDDSFPNSYPGECGFGNQLRKDYCNASCGVEDGICSSVCGTIAPECGGFEPGDSCGIGGTCNDNCQCIGEVVCPGARCGGDGFDTFPNWRFYNLDGGYCFSDGCCYSSIANCDDDDGCVGNNLYDYYCSGGSCVFAVQDCGDGSYIDNYQCSGDMVQRQYHYMGCSGASCYDYYGWVDWEDCNSYDDCYFGYDRDYYCSGGSCTYTSTCTDDCCIAYYGAGAYCSDGVCYAPGCDNDGICETGAPQNETYLNCPNDCCASDCTATYDSTCHSACNGWNGCSFTSGCDGVSSGANTCCNTESQATCCEGACFDCGSEYWQCCNSNCGYQHVDYGCTSNSCWGPAAGTCYDCGSYACSAGSCTTVCSQVCGAECDDSGDCASGICQADCTCLDVAECTEGGSCSNPGEVCCAGGILYECQEVIAFGPSEEVYAYEEYKNQLSPVSKIASLGTASIVDVVKEFWQNILRFLF